jgi:pseudouridine-5'-phosphate glycosidase
MLSVQGEVADALSRGLPVVALESSLVAHGLPRPDNLSIARRIEAAVREEGAVPATVAVLDGTARIGLAPEELDRVATGRLAKLGARDLGLAAAFGRDGATTVSATAVLAARAGIRVFATGGLGGVHLGPGGDESADLVTLAKTGIIVVCAGVKSVLDVPATVQRLETLGVPVVGFRTERFPGFFGPDCELAVEWSATDEREIATAFRRTADLGLGDRALVVLNPLPAEHALDPALHQRAVGTALANATAAGVTGKALTPYLLAEIARATNGASMRANVELVLANARLAVRIAAELAG